MNLDQCLGRLGRHLGQPLTLDGRGAAGLRIGGVLQDVTVEFVPSAGCVAVHAPHPLDLAGAPVRVVVTKLMAMELIPAKEPGVVCSLLVSRGLGGGVVVKYA